ncbi:MAG: hypothetical protein PHG02_05290 [Oscillospiraceae bacterium]|nr:hypothetical protein [Oscillospiraceae bacterium]
MSTLIVNYSAQNPCVLQQTSWQYQNWHVPKEIDKAWRVDYRRRNPAWYMRVSRYLQQKFVK